MSENFLDSSQFALAVGEPDDAVHMPGSRLLQLEACNIWIGPPTLPNLTVVRRVRLGQGDLVALIERVREAITNLGRRSARWWITPLSTPPMLDRTLLSHSLEIEDAVILAMAARCSSLATGPSQVEVRRAETLADYITCSEISSFAFGTEPSSPEAVAEVFEADRAEARLGLYMALIDGRPVASARATFAPQGVVLNGGATLPDARGRGAYRALISARCREAVARNIEWVFVQARPSAAPILSRLGFETVGEIQVLIDSW
jgi:hypothetical protein